MTEPRTVDDATVSEADGFVKSEDALSGSSPAAASNISREFLTQQARGHEPFCSRPWRTLKVTLNGRTKICCDFFTLLPNFEFPTARDFHRNTGMWNNPFMQHMRRTMGVSGEVPFCRLCLTADKRSPEYSEQRIQAKRESLDLYRRFQDEVHQRIRKGTLDQAPDDLRSIKVKVEHGKVIAPFRVDRTAYRRMVEERGFLGRERVLLFGCVLPAIAPFLAEASRELAVVDASRVHLRRTRLLCEAFDLAVKVYQAVPGERLRIPDDRFDAIWVNGAVLCGTGSEDWLPELRRILSPSGTMHIHLAPGIAPMLEALATDPDPDRSAMRRALLRTGFARQERIRYVAQRDLRALLRHHGLRFDVAIPPSVKWQPADHPDLAVFGGIASEEVDFVRRTYGTARAKDDPSLRLERFVSFSALKRLDGTSGR